MFAPALHAEPSLLDEARQALAERLPQIATQKLRIFLSTPDLAAEDRRAATLAFAEALLAAGQHDDALAVLKPLAADPDARLLQAHIFAAAGRWAEALPLYRDLKPDAARLGEAEALQALGETARAADVLEPFVRAHPGNIAARLRLTSLLIESRKLKPARELLAATKPVTPGDLKWRRYIEARMLLAEGQAAPALAAFTEITRDREHLTEHLLAAAMLGSAEARIALEGYDDADKELETFLWRYPESPWLELVFRRLDQIYAAQKNPTEGELQKWTLKPPARRTALARYYLARLQMRGRKWEKAATTLELFVPNHRSHPLLPAVHLMQSDLALQRRDFPAAERALEDAQRAAKNDDVRAEIELRTGLVHYQQGKHLLAAQLFHNAAQRDPRLRERATFDAALAALGQRNFDGFLEDYRELTTHYPDSPLRSELILEQGLTQARVGDARAADTLQLFGLHFPTHARSVESRLALAELAFAAGDHDTTDRYLRIASPTSRATSAAAAEVHAEYLAIFVEDAKQPRDEEAVIQLARGFIERQPQSPLLPEVRMKLGQIYFRRDDFANAETQFATLAREAPQSDYAETALYLAGESAMKQINPDAVTRALGLFDEVSKRRGPLELHARQQQAIVQSRLGKEEEAITLYDIILAATPGPELRFAAMCGKGDNLLALGQKDPAKTGTALGVFEELAAAPGVTAVWRNQALYKKAKALEQLARNAEALTAYYDVLAKSAGADREYFWYYKAGFDAARIFEAQEQWKSALAIYEKMAAAEGPRAAEARARVKNLRLEKFIWE